MSDLDTLHIYCAKGSNTKARLSYLAKANKRSLSAEMQVLIDEAFESHQRKMKRELRG